VRNLTTSATTLCDQFDPIQDVNLNEKRQKMVFAETKHLDDPDDHYLVVSHVKDRAPVEFSPGSPGIP
jgi:hypothetical protein